MTKTEVKEEALRLSPRERYELAQELCESVSPEEDAEVFPLHDWHIQALDEALADLQRNPEAGRPSDEVVAELRRKYS